MCAFCAAIPATAAVGAKLNADQLHKPMEDRKPISKITGIVVAILLVCSITYHTLIWRSYRLSPSLRSGMLAISRNSNKK
jgi:hypothetical protein